MPTRNTTVRLGVTNDDQFKRDMRDAGATGDKALDRITKGAKPASAGLKAVDGAAKEARSGIEGMAGSGGAAGRVLSGLGKNGLLAAAGIGALSVGFGKASSFAVEAIDAFDAIGKSADKIGLSTEALQELRFAAGSLAGFTDRQLDTSLQRLSRKMGDAARDVGEAVKLFDSLNISVRNTDGTMRSVDDVLGDVAARMDAMTSEQQKLSTAVKLFDSEGAGMVNVLRDAGSALAETRDRARDLGIVIEDDVIRNAEAMKDEMDTASKVIDLNLKRAFVDLAPTVISSLELFARAAQGLNQIRDAIVGVENASTRGLRKQAVDLRSEISELEAAFVKYDTAVEAGENSLIQDGTALVANVRLENLRKSLAALDAEIAARAEAPAAPARPVGPVSRVVGGGASPARPDPAIAAARVKALADARAMADAETERLRTVEDINVALEAQRLVQVKGLDVAAAYEDSTRDRLARERAAQDASTAARRAGGDPAQAALDAFARTQIEQKKRDADAFLALTRTVTEKRLADEKQASEALVREGEKAAAERLRNESLAARDRIDAARAAARDLIEIEREITEGRAAALAEMERIRIGLQRDRAVSAPVISAAGRVGEARTLAELEVLQKQAQADTNRARIRAAGARAADSAGEFEDPERLRKYAEQRVRLTLQEEAANDAIRARADLLREEDAFMQSVAAAGKRNVALANAEALRQSDEIREVTLGLIDQARGWDSVGDAVLGVAEALDRLGAFDAIAGSLFGGESTQGGGLSSLLGSAVSGIFGGSSAAASASLPSGPLSVGGLLAAARPRAGGGAAVAGDLLRVNEFRSGNKAEFFRPNTSGQIVPLGGDMPAPRVTVQILNPGPSTTARVVRDSTATQARDMKRLTGMGGAY